jgi:hypothetical protein
MQIVSKSNIVTVFLLLFFKRKNRRIDKHLPMASEISPSIISFGGLRLVFLYDYECAPLTALVPHIRVVCCDVFSSLCYFQFLLFLMVLAFLIFSITGTAHVAFRNLREIFIAFSL